MVSQLSILEVAGIMGPRGERPVEKSRFGELVRRARERKGLKAFELADLMHTHGSAISRLENGTFKETPAPDVMRQLSEILGLSDHDMLAALGYALEAPAEAPATPDEELRNRLHRAVDGVPDWNAAPNIARSLAEVMMGVRYDQTPPERPDPTEAPIASSGSAGR